MRGGILAMAAMLALGGCANQRDTDEIVVQRFFGECGALYGASTDIAAADTECGILTTLLNKFEAENPDVRVKINIVAWPGYPQLAAQIAAGDPPDLVTMHQSVINDYQGRGLLEPLDGMLREAGLPPAAFTPASQSGVVKAGRWYGMPWDTIGRLWHINTALMRQAGLMDGDRPILPGSAAELVEHARRFRAATGKPYLIQAQVSAPDFHVANLYTYLLAQGEILFPDDRHIRLATPQAAAIVNLYRRMNAERLTTRDQDFPAATAAFIRGEGGIFPTGTWMIGPYDLEANTAGQPLYRSYAVAPFPQLWGANVSFVDGHAWVVPRADRSVKERAGIVRLMQFLAAHNYDWSRTGQLPATMAALDDPRFAGLPHRVDIAAMARTGRQMPDMVERQGAIQGLIGEELEAAIAGDKPVEAALADAERRVNELLDQML